MKFGVREICNVFFKAKTKTTIGSTTFEEGAPVLIFDSLKTSSVEQAVTTVYAQGGRGNARLIAWDGEKTLTFTMEDALISETGLAILAGAHLYEADDEKKNTLVVHVSETVSYDGTTAPKVSKVPAEKAYLTFYAMALNTNGEATGAPIPVTINSSKEVTGLGSTKGTYMIDYYTAVTENARQIDIEPETFGCNFYIEADTLFRDQSGADHAAQFIIPNGKIQSNLTLSMATTGDPSTFTFTVDCFPGYVNGDLTKKVLASIQILDDATVAGGIDDPAGDLEDVPDTARVVVVEEE